MLNVIIFTHMHVAHSALHLSFVSGFFFPDKRYSGRSTTASLKLTALMHSSELLTCAWAWICIWLCELVWCLVGVCQGVNPVTQPLAMFVFKVNESLPPSAARILCSKECPLASVDMGLACHTRLKRPELQNLLRKFIKTIVIFALKTKFCVNSLYFLFRLRKQYGWIIVQHADSDKAHWQPALPVSTTSILYCVFISPFHLLSAPQCNGEMAPFAIFLSPLSQKNESVARALLWICCKVSLPPELGGMRGRIKKQCGRWQHTPKKIWPSGKCITVCLYLPLTKTSIWSRMCVSTRRAAVAALLNEPLVESTTMQLCGAQEGSKQRAAWSRPAVSGEG